MLQRTLFIEQKLLGIELLTLLMLIDVLGVVLVFLLEDHLVYFLKQVMLCG